MFSILPIFRGIKKPQKDLYQVVFYSMVRPGKYQIEYELRTTNYDKAKISYLEWESHLLGTNYQYELTFNKIEGSKITNILRIEK